MTKKHLKQVEDENKQIKQKINCLVAMVEVLLKSQDKMLTSDLDKKTVLEKNKESLNNILAVNSLT